MNYLTLEKKSKNTYFQLCIVIFEEEQKNFFNTTSNSSYPGLSSLFPFQSKSQ